MTPAIVSLRDLQSIRPGARRRRARAGFTVIEILAVTAIIGALATLAIPKVHDVLEKAKVARAIGDIRAIQSDLDGQDSLPATLAGVGRSATTDPWGHPYRYLRFPPRQGGGAPRGARRDRFLVPINTTYDLYSMGKDGNTSVALTAHGSRDDVVRANDGGYIGLAAQF